MSRPKIVKLLTGVHMGLGHEGLSKLIRDEASVNVAALARHELILCMNTAGDKMKVVGSKGLVLGYLRMPRGQKIMREALQYIPQTFGATGFSYAEAERKALFERLYGRKSKSARTPTAQATA